MTEHPAPEPTLGVPDSAALKRRVLLTGVVAFALFMVIAYTIAWLEVDDAWLLVAMGLVYLLVVRPMMRPVREAIQLRRRLAYHAYLEEKKNRS